MLSCLMPAIPELSGAAAPARELYSVSRLTREVRLLHDDVTEFFDATVLDCVKKLVTGAYALKLAATSAKGNSQSSSVKNPSSMARW